MQTTTTTTATKPGTIRRTALLLTTALALFGGLTAVGVSPASAATTGNVTFCLRSGPGPYASLPVNLYWANPGGTFQYWKSGTTNAQGCATWKSLPTGFYYRTEGYYRYNVGSQVWYISGWTGYGWLSGSSLTLATGTVQGPFRIY